MSKFLHLNNRDEIISTDNLLSISRTCHHDCFYIIKLVYESKNPILVNSDLNQYEHTYDRLIKYTDSSKRDEDYDKLKMIICS